MGYDNVKVICSIDDIIKARKYHDFILKCLNAGIR